MTTIELVRNFLVEQEYIEKDEVVAESESLLEQGLIDSVGIFKLVALLQEKYQITIKDDDLMPENFDSLAAINSYVSSKL